VGGQQLREHNILDTIEEQITWSTAASTPQILIIDSFHKHSDEKHLEKQVLGAESQDELTNEAEVTVGFEPQLEEAVVLSFGRSQSGQGGASNSPEKERKTKVISQNDTEQDTERKPSRMERRVVAQNGLPPELRRRDYALGKRERMTDYAGPLPHLKWSTPGRELYKTYALWMEPHGPL
ncbi:unnamed protein product, partial [Durusdinium trenchii]